MKELAMGHTGQELSHAQDIKYDEKIWWGWILWETICLDKDLK